MSHETATSFIRHIGRITHRSKSYRTRRDRERQLPRLLNDTVAPLTKQPRWKATACSKGSRSFSTHIHTMSRRNSWRSCTENISPIRLVARIFTQRLSSRLTTLTQTIFWCHDDIKAEVCQWVHTNWTLIAPQPWLSKCSIDGTNFSMIARKSEGNLPYLVLFSLLLIGFPLVSPDEKWYGAFLCFHLFL
jgi:hypothetical protein